MSPEIWVRLCLNTPYAALRFSVSEPWIGTHFDPPQLYMYGVMIINNDDGSGTRGIPEGK